MTGLPRWDRAGLCLQGLSPHAPHESILSQQLALCGPPCNPSLHPRPTHPHPTAAGEVVEILGDALCLAETPIPLKLARLFLLSDILHNTASGARGASRYRRCGARRGDCGACGAGCSQGSEPARWLGWSRCSSAPAPSPASSQPPAAHLPPSRPLAQPA